jgi:hypothetical protein
MSDTPDDRFTPRPFPASTIFADLREACLERSEKRMPIWRVRFAPDLVAQIQPKPVALRSRRAIEKGLRQQLVSFVGKAVMTEGAAGWMLQKYPDKHYVPAWWAYNFSISDDPDDAAIWLLNHAGGCWKSGALRDGYVVLRERVFEQLKGGFLDAFNSESMLSPVCLLCGKTLSDTASMARRVGPECWGSASLRVPGLLSVRRPLVAEAVAPAGAASLFGEAL